jgi:hypothetical protein
LTHRTEASTHKPYAVVQAFFCHGYFFKRQEKNKRAVANATNKNPRQKNCLKLNNIMAIIVSPTLMQACSKAYNRTLY